LIEGEDYPPFENGLPCYPRIRGVLLAEALRCIPDRRERLASPDVFPVCAAGPPKTA
jgi:hypothetical protein